MNEPAFHMTAPGADGARIPFLGADVDVRLGVALAGVVVEQRWRNAEDRPIEATYTFPLPAAATLVSLEIVLGERVLRAEAQALAQAEKRYDAAVAAGDGAFLLRKVNEAVYAIALGNVRPGEEVRIRIAYAEPLRPLDGRLRFRLPTVLAPHYGDPAAGGHRPEDAPVTDLRAAYEMRVAVRLERALAAARIASPTHRIGVRATDDGAFGLVVDVPPFEMDRDFVLDVEPPADVPVSTATAFVDTAATAGEPRHGVLVGGIVPAGSAPRRPRDFVLLIDCSGSMAGDSIAQARRGATGILQSLAPADSFRILRFGNGVDAWHATEQRATPAAVREAIARLAHLEADMGGTEIGAALLAAAGVRKGATPPSGADAPKTDILLVTDGNSYIADEALASIAARARVFCVGVGSAVSEALLRALADRSGGACELVTPNEHMHEVIRRQAERMATTRVSVRLELADDAGVRESMPFEAVVAGIAPADAPCVVPAAVDAFPGDPVSFAGWTSAGTATPTLVFGEMSVALTRSPARDDTALAALRVAGRLRYESLVQRAAPATECAAIAARYGLVSAHTAMVAVDVRVASDRTEGAPETRVVPQMLAAGWGATSTVAPLGELRFSVAAMDDFDAAASAAEAVVPAAAPGMAPSDRARVAQSSAPFDAFEMPAFLRKEKAAAPRAAVRSESLADAELRAIRAALDWLRKHGGLDGIDLATLFDANRLGPQLARLVAARRRLERIDRALARHAMALHFLEMAARSTDPAAEALRHELLAALPDAARAAVEGAIATP